MEKVRSLLLGCTSHSVKTTLTEQEPNSLSSVSRPIIINYYFKNSNRVLSVVITNNAAVIASATIITGNTGQKCGQLLHFVPSSLNEGTLPNPGSLSIETCTALVHAFVLSKLDYCNSLLAGESNELINKLQSVLRSAARLVLRKRKFDPITDDLRDHLHWFPIRQEFSTNLEFLSTSACVVMLLHTLPA